MSIITQDVSAITLCDRRTIRRESRNGIVASRIAMMLSPLQQNNVKDPLHNRPGPGAGAGPGPSSSNLLPPTPPADSMGTFPRCNQHTSLAKSSPNSLSSQQERSHPSGGSARSTSRPVSRPNTIVLPVGNSMAQQLHAPSTSLNRAIDALGQ